MTPVLVSVTLAIATFATNELYMTPDISPNDSNNGIVLRDERVRDSDSSGRPFHRRKPSSPPKSGCTYSVMYIVCPTPGPAPAGAVFTPGMAQSAVRSLPMPALVLHVQPSGPTLVNADTIFYAEPEPFSASIDLLGHTIEVRAEAIGFTWVHGDGSSQSTESAGEPYPSRDITHRYLDSSAGFGARVDTTYAVEFSIDGDGWEELDEPLVATGPTTSIEVQEAAPVLVR